MRISDWSSEVCSSDLILVIIVGGILGWLASIIMRTNAQQGILLNVVVGIVGARSEEHTSELQSLMRISYAVFCLKKKYTIKTNQKQTNETREQYKQT